MPIEKDDNKKTKSIFVPCNLSFKTRIKKAAIKSGFDVANFTRIALLEKIKNDNLEVE